MSSSWERQHRHLHVITNRQALGEWRLQHGAAGSLCHQDSTCNGSGTLGANQLLGMRERLIPLERLGLSPLHHGHMLPPVTFTAPDTTSEHPWNTETRESNPGLPDTRGIGHTPALPATRGEPATELHQTLGNLSHVPTRLDPPRLVQGPRACGGEASRSGPGCLGWNRSSSAHWAVSFHLIFTEMRTEQTSEG